jgi:hypothetical protein
MVFGVAVNTREYDTDVAVIWLEFLAHILESLVLNFVQVFLSDFLVSVVWSLKENTCIMWPFIFCMLSDS